MTPQGLVESILFVSGKRVEKSLLLKVLSESFQIVDVDSIVQLLNEGYISKNSGLRIIRIGDGYQMVSSPEYYQVIKQLFGSTQENDELSDALLETLTIIAYKQPIEKSEIDKIRGVSSSRAISALLEKGFIKPVGNDNISDKVSYVTTTKFLEYFNLKDLGELPDIDIIRTTLEK